MTTKTEAGIWERAIGDGPIAVIDFETTGLSAGRDRVVEVSVVRCDPGLAPRVVFDTLIHPQRAMDATFVHGLTDKDVAEAPKFADIAGWFVEAVQGCVIASYNISFDMAFLRHELKQVGIQARVPNLCLMYLRPMLGFGRHCNLAAACRAHVVSVRPQHTSATDALAAAGLWQKYRQAMDDRDLKTFRDLADLGGYRFVDSFQSKPMNHPNGTDLARGPLLSRYSPPTATPS
jgi:DNA polymerase III epsilon subunit-like protein